jgi:TM2 domain-containing membrane protein YozV
MKKVYYLLFFILITLSTAAQNNQAEELRFSRYLYSQSYNFDNITLLNNHLQNDFFKEEYKDTALIYLLCSLIDNKEYRQAVNYADKYDKNNVSAILFLKNLAILLTADTSYIASKYQAYKKNNSIAEDLLNNIYNLLFEHTFISDLNLLYNQANKNEKYLINELLNFPTSPKKNKKPFVAALLSSIFPGLGKIYAGETEQALISLFPFSIITAQFIEAYILGGLINPITITFASILAIYYSGNIIGSYYAVKRNQQYQYYEKKEHIHAALLVFSSYYIESQYQ